MSKALILGFVQGLTEFLPVSSSGHLALVTRLFPGAPSDFFLAVFLHGGTLGATFVFFRRDIARLCRALGPGRPDLIGALPARAYLAAIALGSLPVILLGLPLRHRAESAFRSLPALAAAFLVTAAWLALPGLRRDKEGNAPLGPGRALLVGAAQAAALFPGISRSGATIATGLLAGLSRAEAFRFSFLLSLPAVTAAFCLEIFTAAGPRPAAGLLAAGLAASFLGGLAALHLLRKAVVAGRLVFFSAYLCLLAAGIVAFTR